jgi:hypothetical protein
MSASNRIAFLSLALTGCFLDRGVSDIGAPARDAGQRPDVVALPGDRDGDGVPDAGDNCPDDPNPEQADLDRDGAGDACDATVDGDLIPEPLDLCPDRDSRGAPDEDGDTITDACDACPLDADATQPNADLDRLGDACEDPDQTRFSRVAFLETFESGLGALQAIGSGWTPSGGAVRIETDGQAGLWHAEDPAFPANFAVHVVGGYEHASEGWGASGSFGVLLHWRSEPTGYRGYAMEARGADDRARVLQRNFWGDNELLAQDLTPAIEDGDGFSVRGTAFGDELAIVVSYRGTTARYVARDSEVPSGGFGLGAAQGAANFRALAVYAP